MYPESRYAAKRARFECHVVARRYVLHESVELRARFDSLSRALGGAHHGAKGGGDRGIFGIERMYRDTTRRCAVCVGEIRPSPRREPGRLPARYLVGECNSALHIRTEVGM